MEDFLKKHLGKDGVLRSRTAVEVNIGGSTYKVQSVKPGMGDVSRVIPEEIRDVVQNKEVNEILSKGNYAADRSFDTFGDTWPNPNFNLKGVRTGRLSTREQLDSKSPESHYREGVRRCIRAGISQERLIEIMNLEIAQYVMDC